MRGQATAVFARRSGERTWHSVSLSVILSHLYIVGCHSQRLLCVPRSRARVVLVLAGRRRAYAGSGVRHGARARSVGAGIRMARRKQGHLGRGRCRIGPGEPGTGGGGRTDRDRSGMSAAGSDGCTVQ